MQTERRPEHAPPREPSRVLALGMIEQAIRDLEAHAYKGKDRDPDAVIYIFGDGDAEPAASVACRWAGVALGRLQSRAREILRAADTEGVPLAERDFADPKELEADEYEWVRVADLGVMHESVYGWGRRRESVKTVLAGHRRAMCVRVDAGLRDALEDYIQRAETHPQYHKTAAQDLLTQLY